MEPVVAPWTSLLYKRAASIEVLGSCHVLCLCWTRRHTWFHCSRNTQPGREVAISLQDVKRKDKELGH